MSDVVFLQSLIDESKGTVVFPNGEFFLDKPLEVGDNTRILCSPKTHIAVKDGAFCPLLVCSKRNGEITKNIIIEGGVWDGNNKNQSAGRFDGNAFLRNTEYTGQLIILSFVENLSIIGLTIKDPYSFGIMLTAVNGFIVKNIFFDYNMSKLNMDGLHINGYAKNGIIANIKGSTNDDMIALNSDEGFAFCDKCDIENIAIDGVYGGDNGYTAVRLLSRKARIENINIRNIFGAFRFNVVSFTHWDDNPDKYGHFDNISIENLFVKRVDGYNDCHGGLIWFQDKLFDVGTVSVRNVFRQKNEVYAQDVYTVDIGRDVRINNLIIDTIVYQGDNVDNAIKIGEGAIINSYIKKNILFTNIDPDCRE